MKSTRMLLSIGAIAAILALGALAAGSASAAAPRQSLTPSTSATDPAAQDRPHPIRFIGRVDRVGTDRLLMTARDGITATVRVTDTTWILVPQNGSCAQGRLSDIQTGQPAAVAGMTTNQRGVINARVVAQCRMGIAEGNLPRLGQGLPNAGALPSGGKGLQELAKHVGAGTIKSISGSTIMVTSLKGTDITVNTTADTVVVNNGFKSASSLKVGDKVGILGRPDKSTSSSTRTINAWAIRVDNTSTQMMVGRVESVNGNTLTLKTPRHKDGVQITLATNAGYKALMIANQQLTLTNATQADVKTGSNLVIEAAPNADGKSYTTNAVVIAPTLPK